MLRKNKKYTIDEGRKNDKQTLSIEAKNINVTDHPHHRYHHYIRIVSVCAILIIVMHTNATLRFKILELNLTED